MRNNKVMILCLGLFIGIANPVFTADDNHSTKVKAIEKVQVMNAFWGTDPRVQGFISPEFPKYQCFLLKVKFSAKVSSSDQIGDFLTKAGAIFHLVAQGKPAISAQVFEARYYKMDGRYTLGFALTISQEDFAKIQANVPYLLTAIKSNHHAQWVIQKKIRLTKPAVVEDSFTVERKRITFSADIDHQKYCLEAMLYKPAGNEKYPLIIMNHGRFGPHPSRDPNEINEYENLNQELASQGFIVMMLVRRGYGNSEGPDSELQSTAVESGLEAAKDIKSAVEFMHGQEDVLQDKVVIMGHSQGGWAALASSTVKMEGVIGVVNLCGGTNYGEMGSGDVTAAVQRHWIAACGEFGKTNLVPSLWIYSKNDRNHPPREVKKMFAAFQASGGKGELIIKAPFGDNGHMIVDDPDLLMDDLLRFFHSIGFQGSPKTH